MMAKKGKNEEQSGMNISGNYYRECFLSQSLQEKHLSASSQRPGFKMGLEVGEAKTKLCSYTDVNC